MTTFGTDWTRDEAEVAVAHYFVMLRAELAGDKYVKASHIRDVATAIGRTAKSVEWKFQNVSAVLIAFGYPYIAGYKPAWNYQTSLEGIVLEHVAGETKLWAIATAGPIVNPLGAKLPDGKVSNYMEPPPALTEVRPAIWTPKVVGTTVDFVRRDAENRDLGRRGEEFVVEFERRRLQDEAKQPDLAKRVEWSSQTRGDGLGYDIRSFGEGGRERFIEVKTTGLGKYFPFVVTANEVQCSEHFETRYSLYRVFDFSREPRLYVLDGRLTKTCALTATQYRARPQ